MDLNAARRVRKKRHAKQEKEKIVRERRQLLPVCSVHRQKAPFPRSWNRLLVSVPSQLTALMVLKRLGVCKDIRNMIVWEYLGRFAFHCETNTLVQERIGLAREFYEKEKQKRLMDCVKFETRLLKFETGDMVVHHNRSFTKREHPKLRRTSPPRKSCLHRGVWARVQFPPESGSLVYWSKHVLE